MTALIITQAAVETLSDGTPAERVTQEAVEVLSNGTPAARLTQEAVEVLSDGTPAQRLTQVVVEILGSNTATMAMLSQAAVEVLSSSSELPTNVRLTQEAVEVLSRDSSAAQLSRLVRLSLGQTQPQANTTRMARLSLSQMLAAARVTRMVRLTLADAVPCLTFWAHCWRLQRTDGRVFTFTSHDTPVDFRGERYLPCASLTASASELGAMVGDVGNMELMGVIDDDSITETDLVAGKFDAARIEVWLFPWSNAGGETPRRLIAGNTGNLKVNLKGYSAEVLTESQKLSQKSIVQTYTPGCRFELGDARCTVNLPALTVAGTVTWVHPPESFHQADRRIFQDHGRAEATGYFDLGKIAWTTGANTGFSTEIKTYDGATGEFRLWEAMPYPIAIGDTFTASPGCDLLKTTCKTKFNNLINFGGFADVPGGDAVANHPNAGGSLG